MYRTVLRAEDGEYQRTHLSKKDAMEYISALLGDYSRDVFGGYVDRDGRTVSLWEDDSMENTL